MANRSYLYAVDEIPGEGAPTKFHALSEWNWDVPIVHRVLLTGSPRLCDSAIWSGDDRLRAIIGDYDDGVANLRRFFAAMPQSPETAQHQSRALAALEDPARRARYLLLEVTEIVEMVVDADENGDVDDDALRNAYETQLAEIGTVESWIKTARSLPEGQLEEATGGDYWPEVLYFTPVPESGTAQEPEPEPQPTPPSDGATIDQTPVDSAAVQPDPEASAAPATPPPASPPVAQQQYAAPPPQPGAAQPQYAGQPQYAQPQYAPQPQYTQQPQYVPAYPAPPTAAPTGGLSWGLGLIALVPIPFVSAIVSGIVMMLTGNSQRRYPGTAGGNGRNAANWGLTYLLATVVLAALHFFLLFELTRDAPQSDFFPIGIPITIWLLVSVAHIVFCIVGLVRASQRKTFTAPAIPFISAR